MLTINGLVTMAHATSEANGWHDDDGKSVDPGHAEVQIAALAPVVLALGHLVEVLRKPVDYRDIDAFAVATHRLWRQARKPHIEDFGAVVRSTLGNEAGAPLMGSRAQVTTRLLLIVSEIAEAIQVLHLGDDIEFADELADVVIRLGDLVGDWNAHAQAHGRKAIDLEAVILAKNERNKTRGYRHGGKLA